jgi:hypothetical protein
MTAAHFYAPAATVDRDPIGEDRHPFLGEQRVNFTFRKAG